MKLKAKPLNLYLASQSPARQLLVSRLLKTSFPNHRLRIGNSSTDERQIERHFRRDHNARKYLSFSLAKKLALLLANSKRQQDLFFKTSSAPESDALILGCDQLLYLPKTDLLGEVLGKPGSHSKAKAMLRKLSGKKVYLITAMSLGRGPKVHNRIQVTVMQFATLANFEIEEVLLLDKPYGCSGSFMFECHGANLFKSVKTDDPTAIQGISVMQLRQLLEMPIYSAHSSTM